MENRVTISLEEYDDLRTKAKKNADEITKLADEKFAEHKKMLDGVFTSRHEDDVKDLDALKDRVKGLEQQLNAAEKRIAELTKEANDLYARKNNAIRQYTELQTDYEKLVRRGWFARLLNLGI